MSSLHPALLEEDEDRPRRAHRYRPRAAPDAAIDGDTPWEDDDRCWYVVQCHPKGLTLDEIGQLIGTTRERVRQIEASGLEKLREVVRRSGASMEDVLDVWRRQG